MNNLYKKGDEVLAKVDVIFRATSSERCCKKDIWYVIEFVSDTIKIRGEYGIVNINYKKFKNIFYSISEIRIMRINELLNNIDQYIKLQEGHHWNDELIKNCDIDYTIERGLKKGQLHIHIMFKIRHFTKIQLNYEKIKKNICDELGLNNIYMYNRFLKPNESENVKDYINKYI